MAVKRFNPETNKWEIFPGTAGDDAYIMAQENGYTGSREEYISTLVNIPGAVYKLSNIDDTATENSDNLVDSNAVWKVKSELMEAISQCGPAGNPYPTRTVVSYAEGMTIFSGCTVINYNSTEAIIAAYTEGTFENTFITSSKKIETWNTTSSDLVVLLNNGLNNEFSDNIYVYEVTWLSGSNVIRVEALNAEDIPATPTEPTPEETEPVGPVPVTYTVIGHVVYEDDKPYFAKEVFVGFDGIYRPVNPDQNGRFECSYTTLDTPTYIVVEGAGTTLYSNSNVAFVDNIFEISDALRIPILSGQYTLSGEIYYSDDIPYEGLVKWTNGEIPTQEEYVEGGKFNAILPKTISSVDLEFYVRGEKVDGYTNLPVSYHNIYNASFEKIVLEYASTTATTNVNSDYAILGTLVDIVGNPCSDEDVIALLDGAIYVNDQTDSEGNFEFNLSVPTAPNKMYLVVGEHKTEEYQLAYNSDREANLGTISVNALMGEYSFKDTIQYNDGQPYSGQVSWIASGEHHQLSGVATVSDGVFEISDVKEQIYSMEVNMYVHGSFYPSGSLDVTKEGRIYKFKNSPLVISYASTTEEPAEPVQYNVTVNGKIEYSDGKGFDVKDVFVVFNDKYAVTDKTDSEGMFSVQYPAGTELPTKVTISAAGLTLKSWEGNDLFDNTQTFNISETLIVPDMSAMYLLKVKINYSDSDDNGLIPYVGKVTISNDNIGWKDNVWVDNGEFEIVPLPEKLTSIKYSLVAPDGETTISDTYQITDYIFDAESKVFVGSMEVNLAVASTTAEPQQSTYKLQGTINYYDGVGFTGTVQVSDGVFSFDHDISGGQFICEWTSYKPSDKITITCLGERLEYSLNDWDSNKEQSFDAKYINWFSDKPILKAVVKEAKEPYGLITADNISLQYIVSGYAYPRSIKIGTITNGELECQMPQNDVLSGISQICLTQNDVLISGILNSESNLIWPNSLECQLKDDIFVTLSDPEAVTTPAPEYAIMGVIQLSDGSYYTGKVRVVTDSSSDSVDHTGGVFTYTFGTKPVTETVTLECNGYKPVTFTPEWDSLLAGQLATFGSIILEPATYKITGTVYYEEDGNTIAVNDVLNLQYSLLGSAQTVTNEISIIDGEFQYEVPNNVVELGGMCDLQLLQGDEEVSDKLNEGSCVYFGNNDVINLGPIVLENYQSATATTTANPEEIVTTTTAKVSD